MVLFPALVHACHGGIAESTTTGVGGRAGTSGSIGAGGHPATSAHSGSGGADAGKCPSPPPASSECSCSDHTPPWVYQTCSTEGEQCTWTIARCFFTATCHAGQWSKGSVDVDGGVGDGGSQDCHPLPPNPPDAGVPASDECGPSGPVSGACVTECAQCIYGDGAWFQTFTCHGGGWWVGCLW
jgi:hypothetical protein